MEYTTPPEISSRQAELSLRALMLRDRKVLGKRKDMSPAEIERRAQQSETRKAKPGPPARRSRHDL
jgi:hypothetical protein